MLDAKSSHGRPRAQRALILTAALVGVVGCGDPAEFRPARNVTDYPAVKDAYRVQQAGPDCESLGTAHVQDSDSPIEDLAATAARHGGTHYVVRMDQTSLKNGMVTMTESALRVQRTLWAQVYRCTS